MIQSNTPDIRKNTIGKKTQIQKILQIKKKYSENLKKIPVRPEKLQFSEKIRR